MTTSCMAPGRVREVMVGRSWCTDAAGRGKRRCGAVTPRGDLAALGADGGSRPFREAGEPAAILVRQRLVMRHGQDPDDDAATVTDGHEREVAPQARAAGVHREDV